MPKLNIDINKEFMVKIEAFEKKNVGIIKQGLYEGAKVAMENIKPKIPVDTGDLKNSFGISKMREDENGVNVKLGFDGYDRKGVANQLKARVLESGTSKIKKRPFLRPAVNACKTQIETAVKSKIEQELKKR